jgi:hypothetical protein
MQSRFPAEHAKGYWMRLVDGLEVLYAGSKQIRLKGM